MLPSLYYDNRWKKIEVTEKALELASKHDIPIYLASHLIRLFEGKEDIEDFLSPSSHLSLIEGTKELAERFHKGIIEKKKILLFGDYDVDGLSSVALMENFLRANGVKVSHFIPSRYKEGYGLTKKALEGLPETELLITFDCGIGSTEEVELLKASGVEVLVTDHHQPGPSLPACPIINPQLGSSFRDLAGVGVAYKLALYLSEVYGYQLPEDSLAYVMLGTVSDLMPLLGENRYLVKEGLEVFNKTSHPGLLSLRRLISGEVSAQDIAFKIGPMINAAGRLDDASEALDLLLGDGDLDYLLERLITYNEKRKKEEALTLEEAIKKVNLQDPLILVKGDWKKGVLGLAASRLSTKYRKPAIVLDSELSGSSRSIGNFSIIDALRNSSDCLSHYGGHTMAAGLKIERGSYEDFKKSIFNYTSDKLDFLETRKTFYHIPLKRSHINLRLLDELDLLSPYGIGNPQINFSLTGLEFLSSRALGSSGRVHLLSFKSEDRRLEFLSFEEKLLSLKASESYDVIFTVEKDLFRDILSLKLILRDIRPSRPSLEHSNLFFPFYEGLARSVLFYDRDKTDFELPSFKEDRVYKPGDREFPKSFPHPSALLDGTSDFLADLPEREELVKIYSWLKRQGNSFSWHSPKRPLMAMISLIIFEELNLISYTNMGKICYYSILDSNQTKALDESPTFRKVLEIKEDMSGSN